MLLTLFENATTVDDDVFDPRFEEVVSMIDQEQFEKASNLISEIFNNGVLDIRLVMYQLFTKFIAEGIQSIREIFPLISAMMEDYWEKISPAHSRDKYLVHSLTWFFSSISKKLKRSEKLYKEKKPDDFWNQSLQTLTLNDINELIDASHSLADYLKKIEKPSLIQFILFIPKWLEGIRNIIDSEKEVPDNPPPSQSISQKAPPKKETSLDDVIRASEPMIQLVKKLQAFEKLIQEENFEKAALISDDITSLLKNFDPATYFPKLFTQFFALTAAHMDELSQEWENKGSLKWDALHRLYQSDLQEFIKW